MTTITRPFAWIDIPASTSLPAYSIAKYPVTNAQFKLFMDAGGYDQPRWWTPLGWQIRMDEGWTHPRSWKASQWNHAEQPVVDVCWYEAVAFCLWLSEVSGEDIMLPTEQQWQYAAQGVDGRLYPWGDTWDCTRCNNSVSPCSSNITTPVAQYQTLGESPFGVVDMVGNVLEWCLTDYDTLTNDLNSETNIHVIRGGAWSERDPEMFCCDYRSGAAIDDSSRSFGFRIARAALPVLCQYADAVSLQHDLQ
jgi:formylglycine-generating enzyme required for sulfatase activity